MAALDYTALTAATGWTEGFPICQATPVDGLQKTFWRKARVNFATATGTPLTDADWAKIMVIPAHTFVMCVMAVVVVAETAGDFYVGDAGTDGTNNWITTSDLTTINTVKLTPASTNMATNGKYYHTAGALYISASATLNEAMVDLYVKCMTIDPA